jgi:hypothetical protein
MNGYESAVIEWALDANAAFVVMQKAGANATATMCGRYNKCMKELRKASARLARFRKAELKALAQRERNRQAMRTK